MKVNKCIIIHGCPDAEESASRANENHWMPWVKKELDALQVSTEVPLMPEPWEPVYEKYKLSFEKYEVDENTVLVGHSCGCSFLVRWLADSKQKIAKLILVAPWKIAQDASLIDKTFYEFSFDQTINDRVGEIVYFTSDNEYEDGKQGLKMFSTALGGRIINLPNHGHYTLSHMNTVEFPELVAEVVS
jgi:predicted alpha/beta hydrolase family esterase